PGSTHGHSRSERGKDSFGTRGGDALQAGLPGRTAGRRRGLPSEPRATAADGPDGWAGRHEFRDTIRSRRIWIVACGAQSQRGRDGLRVAGRFFAGGAAVVLFKSQACGIFLQDADTSVMQTPELNVRITEGVSVEILRSANGAPLRMTLCSHG